MLLVEREILNLALETLRTKLVLPQDIVEIKECDISNDFDAVVRIMDIDFLCEIKNTVTTATIGNVANRLKALAEKRMRPVLLIGKYITPKVMSDLATNGINSLDCAGNCHIRYVKDGKIIFHLTNKGEKNTFATEKTYPAFQDAGLKVIFYLLQDMLNVNKPYREIQNATGVSLGAIKNVFDVLIERNFILLTNEKRILKNTKILFNLWVENYNQVLKPKLLLGTMSFRSIEQHMNWSAMPLPEGMYWSGEVGANIVDSYLEPAVFDIYTDVPATYLLKTGFVKQNENGEIKIYQKFWKWKTENHLAPLTLLYADLMSSGNSRCQEMAERLLDYGLKNFK